MPSLEKLEEKLRGREGCLLANRDFLLKELKHSAEAGPLPLFAWTDSTCLTHWNVESQLKKSSAAKCAARPRRDLRLFEFVIFSEMTPKRKNPRCANSGGFGIDKEGTCTPRGAQIDDLSYSHTCRPGDDLLSHVLRRSTIGAGAFHGRVRNGIGCSHPAIITRSACV